MSFHDKLKDKDCIELTKYDGADLQSTGSEAQGIRVCVLDLETTGLNKQEYKIIEIALKVIDIDSSSFERVNTIDEYSSFQDPGIVIEDEITRVTGITQDMVIDQEIDWIKVKEILRNSDIVVAHNAEFDRSFMDRYEPLSRTMLWACSVYDINWEARGFSNAKQELLCIWHGFFYDSHRAMSDVNALINLLTHSYYESNPPIKELLANSKQPIYKILATGSDFEKKDTLKSRRYRWDNKKRVWWKKVLPESIEHEKEWLTNNVYGGYYRGNTIEIHPMDKYKLEQS